MNMFMYVDRRRTDHRAIGGPRGLPVGSDTLCGTSTIRRVGLRFNISIKIRQRKTFGDWIALRVHVCLLVCPAIHQKGAIIPKEETASLAHLRHPRLDQQRDKSDDR